jgi:hypothetical protein
LFRGSKRYVYQNGNHLQLVLEEPRVYLADLIRASGVVAVLWPLAVLVALGVGWIAWIAFDVVTYSPPGALR